MGQLAHVTSSTCHQISSLTSLTPDERSGLLAVAFARSARE